MDARADAIRNALARTLALLLGLVLAVAALGKAWELHEFLVVVNYMLPDAIQDMRWLTRLLAVGVIGIEAMLAGLLMFGVMGRRVLVVLAVVLVSFSAALVKLAIDPWAPSCQCLGLLRLAGEIEHESQIGLVRNVAMLWIVGWLFVRARRSDQVESITVAVDVTTSAGAGAAGRERSPAPARRGFTLVELMVVIGIIALLISITLPALRPAKASAMRIRHGVTSHELLIAVHMYAGDNRDYFPYFGTSGDPDGPLLVGDFDLHADFNYFKGQSMFWPSLIYPDYYSARQDLETDTLHEKYHVDWGYPEHVVISHYFMTHAAHAAPAYWADDEAPDDLSLFRGTTLDSVLYPSDKGLYVDIREIGDDAPVWVGMVDGAVRRMNWPSEIDSAMVVGRPDFGATPFPVLSTRYGMHGRDF